ncbi:MAG: twin-arginine translocase TatA/TatE family subunit [Thaumarchaeota archaeon]|nr:twin-arginine translocase TatA/TatE family subunit [Nitrososphaerota archaeon]
MQTAVLQIGGNEWIWIAFIAAILLFGSKKVPEIARALGKAMGEFQRGKMEIERELREAAAQTTASNMPPTSSPPTPFKSEGTHPEGASAPTFATPSSPPSPSEESPAAGKGRLLAAAQALGIETTGKTEQQIKEEIRKAMEQSA